MERDHNTQNWVQNTYTPSWPSASSQHPQDASYLSPNSRNSELSSRHSFSPSCGPSSPGSQGVVFSDFGGSSQHQSFDLSRPLSQEDQVGEGEYSLYPENIRSNPQPRFPSGGSDSYVNDGVLYPVNTGRHGQITYSSGATAGWHQQSSNYATAHTGDSFSFTAPDPLNDPQVLLEEVDGMYPGLPASRQDQPHPYLGHNDAIVGSIYRRDNRTPGKSLDGGYILNEEKATVIQQVESPVLEEDMEQEYGDHKDNRKKNKTKVICEICKLFFKPMGLSRHQIRKHNVQFDPNRKLHKCETPNCFRAFKSPRELRRHNVSHTKEKPFKCYYPDCSRSFTRDDNRRRHIRKYHNSITDGEDHISEAAANLSSY